MIRLPKKIFSSCLFFGLLLQLVVSPAFAQTPTPKPCSRPEDKCCYSYECYGDKGQCLPGAVKTCVAMSKDANGEYKNMECQDGTWVSSTKEPNPGIQGCDITIAGQTAEDFASLSLPSWQKKLEKTAKGETPWNRAAFVGPVGIFAPQETQTALSAEAGGENQNGINSDGGLMLDVVNSVSTIIAGSVLVDQSGQKIGQGGALDGVSRLIASLYTTPPASGVEYLADMGKNFGLVQPVYAQGFGFRGLQPLLPIWKVTRNLTYVLFIFIFLAVGFAIMFRVKISPQAVLTLENALPKIIIAMILINFSYAIVGFLIDLVYVLIGAIIAYLNTNGLLSMSLQEAQKTFLSPGIGTLFHNYLSDGKTYASALATSIGGAIDIPILTKLPFIGGGIAGAVLSFVLVIALLFAFFKVFFSLLMCYVNIIISLIISPFVIMFSALPGKEGNPLSKWFTDLLSNILVFPGVIGIFLLADTIKKATQGAAAQKVWAPPYLIPVNAELVGSLISFGLLMLAPKIPDYIKAMFDPKAKTPPVGATIMAPIAGGFGVAKAPITYPAGVMKEGYEKRAGDILSRLPAREVREKHGILDSLPIISDARVAMREWKTPGYINALSDKDSTESGTSAKAKQIIERANRPRSGGQAQTQQGQAQTQQGQAQTQQGAQQGTGNPTPKP